MDLLQDMFACMHLYAHREREVMRLHYRFQLGHPAGGNVLGGSLRLLLRGHLYLGLVLVAGFPQQRLQPLKLLDVGQHLGLAPEGLLLHAFMGLHFRKA